MPRVIAPQAHITTSGNTLLALIELVQKLRQEEETLWLNIRQKMKMRYLSKFAQRLHTWAVEYQCSQLLEYAATSEKQIQNFDGAHLPRTIEMFPEVRRSLRPTDREPLRGAPSWRGVNGYKTFSFPGLEKIHKSTTKIITITRLFLP
ncbi:MAG: hypothetical protein F6K10_26620 [Moorea sp. SIO2B7]|nr:hypothetical protein [Moorena sp. SIO2B7]